MPNPFDFDLFVIGGGSGGVRAARVAATLGHKVGIAETSRYGGTCVIRGCVPKKLFVYAAHFREHFEDSRKFGWSFGQHAFDWKTLVHNKDREIERLEQFYCEGLKKAGAQTFTTRAELCGPNHIFLVAENRTVTAQKILLATGGQPNRLPSLTGHEHCITSDEAFHLKHFPERIILYGGGYIAVEFAGIFNGLGVDTTLVYRSQEILRGFDRDLRTMLHTAMETKGIRVICDTILEEVTLLENERRHVRLDSGEILVTDAVMLATGRVPMSNALGLESAGVETNAKGHIKVDCFSKTSSSRIWAVGDVTDRVQLTPVAIHEAMCFVETEFRNNPTIPDYDMIPTAVFSQPEIGTIGMSEEQAATAHHSIDIYCSTFRSMKHMLSGRMEKMQVKLVVDHGSNCVLGAHILGENAGEMAQLLAISLKMGATKDDFDRTMAVHPTVAEEFVTMQQPSYRIVDGKRTG